MSFGSELVPSMPAISMAALERVGHELNQLLGIDFSGGPHPIDWPHLITHVLPKHGIHVSPVDPAEIDGDEGATDSAGTGPVNVLLRHDIYDGLYDPGRGGNRSRATMPHELGHCILHVDRIRRFRAHQRDGALLRRRADLKAYCDPEWQAWGLAGCIVAPRSLLTSSRMSCDRLAAKLGISGAFLRTHMARLKMVWR